VLEAAMWGAIAASTLLIGMVAAFLWRPAPRTLGLILAFGAGALFCAVAFELADEALANGGDRLLAVGMLLGAGVFVAGSWLLRSKTDSGVPDADEDSRSIILGAALDGIPESLALGASVAAAASGDAPVSVTLLVAIALSNFPEAIGATVGMLAARHSRAKIVLVWGSLVAASALAAAIGYQVLSEASEVLGARLDAFTAGAIMAMLADTMIPDAYRDAGRAAGMATVLGFGASVLIG
jgi:ZIP family zinc transporter